MKPRTVTERRGYKRGVDPEALYAHLKSAVNWFQCDRCRWHWPETRMVIQDGLTLCRDNCATIVSTDEKEKDIARAGALASKLEANEPLPKRPFVPDILAEPFLTGVNAGETVNLVKGGANVAVPLVGVNLSTSDTIAFQTVSVEQVSITYAADKRSGTLTVKAPAAAVPGDYWMKHNTNLWPGVFRVRA